MGGWFVFEKLKFILLILFCIKHIKHYFLSFFRVIEIRDIGLLTYRFKTRVRESDKEKGREKERKN